MANSPLTPAQLRKLEAHYRKQFFSLLPTPVNEPFEQACREAASKMKMPALSLRMTLKLRITGALAGARTLKELRALFASVTPDDTTREILNEFNAICAGYDKSHLTQKGVIAALKALCETIVRDEPPRTETQLACSVGTVESGVEPEWM